MLMGMTEWDSRERSLLGVLFNKLRFEELVNCRSCCLLLLRVEKVPRLLIVCEGVNLPDIVSWSSALTLDFPYQLSLIVVAVARPHHCSCCRYLSIAR